MDIKRLIKNKKIVYALITVLMAILLGIVYWQRDMLSERRTYSISSTSEISYGKNGHTLVVDNGMKTLLVIDQQGVVVRRYNGGTLNAPFYYAAHVTEAEDGSIYVADMIYGARGNLLEKERIIRLSGNESEVVFEKDYTQMEDADVPLQYGNIFEIQEYQGEILFTMRTKESIELYSITSDSGTRQIASVPFDEREHDISYDASTGMIAITTRTGDICTIRRDAPGQVSRIVDDESQIPLDIVARNGNIYYSDVLGNKIWHIAEEDMKEPSVFLEAEFVVSEVDAASDGKSLLATDLGGYYILLTSDGAVCDDVSDVTEAPVSYFFRTIVIWIVLVAGAALFLYLAIELLKALIHIVATNEGAVRVLFIVLASLSVAAVLSYPLVNQIMSDSLSFSETRLKLFSETLLTQIDPDVIKNINSTDDYDSQAYRDLKENLDRYVQMSYLDGSYLYYIIMKPDAQKEFICFTMDFEDTQPIGRPYDVYGDNLYTEVLETGEDRFESELSGYGAWAFIERPITDQEGNVIAELEVGQNMDVLLEKQAKLGRELAINSVVCTVAVSMLLLELSFLLGFFDNRSGKQVEELDATELVPVRTLMFFSYLTSSMQDVFIAILLSKLYQGGLPFDRGVAVALPMSAELFAMAVFSIVGGKMIERRGAKRGLTAGFLSELIGFVVCLALTTYPGIFFGKVLIGAGMGIIYVSCNSVASLGRDEARREAAFAGVSAGTISGLTIGAGISSVLFSMGGHQLIYLFGIIVLAAGAFLVITSVPANLSMAEAAPEKTAEERPGELSVLGFFFSRRIFMFFLFLLIPFMMSLAYREFFFPVFAAEQGITEVTIGQLYLLCGLVAIYIGPALSGWLVAHIGAKRAIVLATLLVAAAMGLFILKPVLASVVAGLMSISLVTSFAYTCQYTYFDSLDEIHLYGSGAAMGIYSMIESIGQTLGPIVYGSILTLGYRRGISMFAAVILSALGVFVLFGLGSGRKKKKGE